MIVFYFLSFSVVSKTKRTYFSSFREQAEIMSPTARNFYLMTDDKGYVGIPTQLLTIEKYTIRTDK